MIGRQLLTIVDDKRTAGRWSIQVMNGYMRGTFYED